MKYPEHEKQSKIIDKSQVVGEFLEWLEQEGMFVGEWSEGERYITDGGTNKLLARYFDIDLDKIDDEKRQMIEELREMNKGNK